MSEAKCLGLTANKLARIASDLARITSDLDTENAKLRTLIQDMGELLDAITECDLVCKHYHDGCIGDCYYVNARRELGIEVE